MRKGVAIDNGLNGAIVFLNESGEITTYCTPLKKVTVNKKEKNVYDEIKIKDIFLEEMFGFDSWFCVLEKAQAFPKQGGTSNFTNGSGFGFYRGLLLGLGIKYDLIHPKTWQKAFGISGKFGGTKEQAEKVARRYYPGVVYRTKRDRLLDGIADAVCMVEFGRQTVKK